jgi:hypothetical protein
MTNWGAVANDELAARLRMTNRGAVAKDEPGGMTNAREGRTGRIANRTELFSVIPAQAGIQPPARLFCGALDSRLRGNDELGRGGD